MEVSGMKSGKSILSALSVILAGILWGVINLFIRALSAGGLGALEISLLRTAGAALLFSLFLLIRDPKKFRIRFRDIWLFIGTGIVSLVLFNVCYFHTMIASEASVAVVLLYTSPVFVMLLSALFFRERVTLSKILALSLTTAGTVLVAGLLGSGAQLSLPVLLTGIGSGFFYALYSIFGNLALRRYDPMTVTVYTFLFAFAGSIPLGKPLETIRILTGDPELILWGIGIALVSTALPYFFYTYGLARMETGRAAILVAVEPLVGALIGILVFGEEHGLLKLLGILLILAAVVVLNLPSGKGARPS